MTQRIDVGVFGLKVVLQPGLEPVVTSSGLYADEEEWVGCSAEEAERLDQQDLFAAAIEDLVGAHAEAGVDVTSESYRAGLSRAVDRKLSDLVDPAC